ncbi:hypothetical protein [Schinkia azotoformans]|uniref:hypothetical protein n=1 Tax=Schinkia azotoformans TaxID=1454 RepID=UPI002DBCBA34|nr:hypothetical protein [Schinkia azotoformans]MEC1757393.1 hypothetical protein [Schinkia azotoformans]
MENLHNKKSLYFNALIKAYSEYVDGDKDSLKKLIFYGIKTIVSKDKPESYQDAISDFDMVGVIKDLVAELTPAEFMTIFPIDKEYDGEKWGVKDYFYTIDYIKEIGTNEVLGDNALEFLMEYNNKIILLFNVRSMSLVSTMMKYQGKPSLLEQWASDNGIKTYTRHVDATGREYMLDSDGRTTKVNKPRPKYLRLVK